MSEKHFSDHNFREVTDKIKLKLRHVPPTKKLWRCDQCDTEVIFPMSLDIRAVNRLMANRMLCVSVEEKLIN